MPRPLAVVPAAALVLGLTGCALPGLPSSGSSSSAAPSSAAAPASSAPASSAPVSAAPAAADGTSVIGDGYLFTVPDGWGKPTGVATPSGADAFAADLSDKDGFADNVNVVVLKSVEASPAQAESEGAQGLKSIGATEVTVQDRTTVDGEGTAHLSALKASKGVKYRIDQFYVSHSGATYIVTISVSSSVSKSDRDELVSSVLSGWSWS